MIANMLAYFAWRTLNEIHRQLQRQSDFNFGCLYWVWINNWWDYRVDGVITKEQYENSKKELKDSKWKLQHLTGSDSFTEHMKMHISLLEAVISKYEDCYHIDKPVIENIEFSVEVLR